MNISRNMLLATLVTLSFSAFADDAAPAPQQTQPAVESTKPAENTVATTKPAEEAKKAGIMSKVYSGVGTIFHSPVDLIDWMAATFGPQSVAKWLGSAKDKDGNELKEKGMITSFFAAHENAVSRSLAITGTAAVIVAAYKVYQNFIVEDDADEEYADVNVFGDEDFEVENN